jgi:hypothetical protein
VKHGAESYEFAAQQKKPIRKGGGVMSEYDPGQSISGEPKADHQQMVALNKLFYEGYMVWRAIYAAAALGIADVLNDGPMDTKEIAVAVGANQDALYRLLRALTSVGVFTEIGTRRFALTPLAAGLRSDVPGSLKAYLCLYGSDFLSRPADNLLYSVQTGLPAVERVFGASYLSHLKQNPEIAAEFDAGMASISSLDITDVLSAYDFTGIRTIADIGGGNGSFLAAILNTYPDMSGILLERTTAVEGARLHLEATGLVDRCVVISGDFFEKIPAGADAYILKSIMHNWDDARAISILRNCRDAMPQEGKLLIIEPVILSEAHASLSKFLDLTMLVMSEGGRERTEREFQTLLTVGGFELIRVVSTGSRVSIVEGMPVK